MAENEDGQEKTEDPSAKKLADLQKRGNIPQSREVVTVAVLLAGSGAIAMGGGALFRATGEGLVHTLELIGEGGVASVPEILALARTLLGSVSGSLLAILGAVAGVALVAHFVQNPPHFNPSLLAPKLDKLNPIPQIKKRFNLKELGMELLKNLAKVAAVGFVVFHALQAEALALGALTRLGLADAALALLAAAGRVVIQTSLVLIALAAADLAWQRYKYRREAMMTKEEVKKESKEREGSPEVKGRQRRRAREISRNRMLSETRTADVVVVNPTHYAVALRYRQGTDAAPRVVARGVDHLALAIRKAARQAGVPVIEDWPLARLLYRTVRVGQAVPEQLYGAVAAVLAQVYRMRHRRRRAA